MMKDKKPPLLLFVLLASFPTITAVLFTPALPLLARDFQLSSFEGQWMMSLYLVGYSVGHLFYGPLGNGLGRKKALYFGLCLALVGGILCFIAETFWFFCLGRLLQALGAAAGLKLAFTMIGDLYTRETASKKISSLLFGFAGAAGVGPAIGGFLTEAFGWRGNFGFLILYTICLFILSLALPETAKEIDISALNLRDIFRRYVKEFRDSFTVLHGLLMGFFTASIYIFATEAPYIGINFLGLTPAEFGLFSLLPTGGMMCSAFFGNQMAGRVRPRIAMISGIVLMIVGLNLMMFIFSERWFNGWTLFLPYLLILIGGFITWLFASSKALSEARDKSTASAVIQFLNMGIATLGTLIVGAFAPKIPSTLSIAFGACIIVMFFLWLSLHEHHKRSPH